MNVAIIGSGSWATALAKIIMHNVPDINWYIRRQEVIDEFVEIRRNPNHLEWAYFDVSRIHFSADINAVIEQSDLLVLAVPSPYLKQSLNDITVDLSKKMVISAVKGMIPDENLLVTEYMRKHFNVPEENLGVIAGPCHAEEIALERLSYLTVGCKDKAKALQWQKLFTTPYVHTTPSNDVEGLEYASVMKNIYAIAAGICHGLGYGDNFMAVLMTNAFNELATFLNATHPDENRVVKSAAYLGDLLVTGYSQFSRNRTFGNMIGKGYSVKSAQVEMSMVAEGYYASKCIHEINKEYRIDMPIAEAVYLILYEERYPPFVIKQLTEELF